MAPKTFPMSLIGFPLWYFLKKPYLCHRSHNFHYGHFTDSRALKLDSWIKLNIVAILYFTWRWHHHSSPSLWTQLNHIMCGGLQYMQQERQNGKELRQYLQMVIFFHPAFHIQFPQADEWAGEATGFYLRRQQEFHFEGCTSGAQEEGLCHQSLLWTLCLNRVRPAWPVPAGQVQWGPQEAWGHEDPWCQSGGNIRGWSGWSWSCYLCWIKTHQFG